jgi:hypothetical protein
MAIPGQPGQKKFARFHLNEKKLGMVAHDYHHYGRKYKIEGWQYK